MDLGQDMRLVTDLLHELDQKVAGTPTAPDATGSQEPEGIPGSFAGGGEILR